MKIAQLTDFHFDDFLAQRFGLDTPAKFSAMLSDIVSKNFDRLVLTGDFGVPERHSWLAAKLSEDVLPFDIILGNHDTGDDKRESLVKSGLLSENDRQGIEFYYSREFAGMRVLFLDTSRGETSAGQKQWLAEELKPGSDPVTVFAHHPILDCGTAMDLSMALRDRDELAGVLFRSGKDVTVFCGHYHFIHETTKSNVRQFVTPACIMQIRGEGDQILSDSFDFGYRVIEINGGNVTTETKMFVSPRKVRPGE